jgi:hypothetical protein
MKHSRSDGFIKKKLCYRKRTKSCCLSTFFIKEKKELTFKQQTFAPIVTIKDLVPPTINITPRSSYFDRSSSFSTSIHSYLNNRQYSLEEQMHVEECPYCSSESALSIKTDPNNNHLDQISIHSLNLLHAVEMYLSSNPSLNEQFDISSIASQQYAIINETKQLNLCEINEIIYAIHSAIDNNNERNETLDALASSLREVAEETPIVLQNENRPLPPPPPGFRQVLARAVMYEIVMRLFSFYILILICCIRFT